MENRNEDTWYKRNSKLESFLKRSLPSHVYDDIRYYEACVVRAAREGLAFKHVILTSKSVFLTDHPPRVVQEVVRLSDVTSIRAEYDLPEFLKGQERENCQHIRISYRNDESDWKRRTVDGRLSEEEPTSPEFSEEDTPPTRRSLSRVRNTTNSERSSPFLKISPEREPWCTKSDTESPERTIYHRPDTPDFAALTSLVQSVALPSLVPIRRAATPDPSPVTAFDPEWSRPLDDDRVTTRSISALLQRVEDAQPRIPRSRSALDQHSEHTEHSHLRSHSSLDKPRARVPRMDGMLGLAETTSPILDLHLYVLKNGSALMTQLQTCWFARLLVATLQIEEKNNNSAAPVRDPKHLETIYEQFKRELLSPHNSLDQTFELIQELQVGAERNFELKKIFWRDQMLYHFLVQQLEVYLLESASLTSFSSNDPDEVLATRQDQLEMAALLLGTLLTMLRDTDCVQDKIQMLQFNGGSLLRELLVLILTPPHIPQPLHNTCCHMLENFHEFCSSGWYNLPEAELIKLLAEISNLSISILYELLLTIGKLAHGSTALGLAKILDGCKLECHLKRSVTQLLGLLFPTKPQKLKPFEAVLIYQHFFVLKRFMESLTKVQEYIQDQFEEEFRYYINWPRVNRKLPDSYPIKRLLQELVEKVRKMASCGRSELFSTNYVS